MAETLVASDVTVTVAENVYVSVIPTFLRNGNPVSATSITLDSSPSNGTATVALPAITYTPTPWQFSPDAFTFQGAASGSEVASVTITAPGTGYTIPPTVTFGVPPAGGVQATGTATVTSGSVTGITLTNIGSGYVTAPTVTIGVASGTPATATCALTSLTSAPANFNVTVKQLPVTDLGRVTRSFVSGYTAARAEIRRVVRFQKRSVVANFNGAQPAGATITAVRWDCTSPWSVLMANARVEPSGRSVAVDVSFNYAGWGGILATATWQNGETTAQEFFFTVLDRPVYPGAVYNEANGPYVLEADA